MCDRTPDLSNQYLSFAEIQAEVKKWKGDPETTPDAVLLAVRCDVRYTAEEFDIYQQVRKIWGHDLCNRLVVAFTFGDRQDRDLRDEIKTVCRELKSVLRDASGRYVLFRGPTSSENEEEVKQLLKTIDNLPQDAMWLIIKGCGDVLLFIWYLILWILQAVYDCFRGLIGGWNRKPPYRPL